MVLLLERLEDRSLLSATATAVLSGGVLTVTGRDQADAFTLRFSKGTLTLTTSAGQSWKFSAAAVARIEASLGGGNDNWNGLATGFGGSQVIRGGAGSDAITTGTGNDTIFGDAGNDSLIGWAGRDIIHGGDGDDWIALNSGDGSNYGYPGDVGYGGDGNDTMIGGSNDSLFGEAGNDKLTASGHGVFGGTYLDGGVGDDVFYTRQGQYRARDVIVGGAGYDRIATFDVDARGNFYEVLPKYHGVEKIG